MRQFELLSKIEVKQCERIVEAACLVCNMPVSIVTLLDTATRQYKKLVGFPKAMRSLEVSFCSYALANPDRPFIVPDARLDKRFQDPPLVHVDIPIVFYAGFPLAMEPGTAVGMLCLIDDKPRELTADQHAIMSKLADQLVELFRLHTNKHELQQVLNEQDQHLEDLTLNMKTALRCIEVSAEVLQHQVSLAGDEAALVHLSNIKEASNATMRMINEVSDPAAKNSLGPPTTLSGYCEVHT